jgi:GntR family transcriptional regulator
VTLRRSSPILIPVVVSRGQPSITARLAAAIDRTNDRPISRQLADLVWTEIIDGTLRSGERLPTVRQLAIDLGVHPRVVERAFAELERRGVVRVEPGGAFVALVDGEPGARERARALEDVCADTVARAEELGFSIDDVIEALADLRLDRGSRRPP